MMSRIRPSQRILGLIAMIGLVDVVLLAALSGVSPRLTDVDVGFLILVAAFACVEWQVIHVQFRAEASSFSLFEVPLVVGLLYSSPAVVVLATLIGTGIGFIAGRRQPLLKVLFNAANLGLYAAVAAFVVSQWPAGGGERMVWLSGLVGVAVGSAMSFGLIVLAVTLAEGFPGIKRGLELLYFGLVVSISNTTIGLTAAIILARDAVGLLLLAVPAFLLFTAFRMITAEREQRERIEFLYRSTRRLDLGASESGLATLLEEARVMFRAEIGAVVLEDADTVRLFHSTSSAERSTVLDDVGDVGLFADVLEALDEPTIVSVDDVGPLADLIGRLGGRDAMLAKLSAEQRDLGAVMIANRLGEVTSFTDNDLQVLGALARQSAFLMHSDRLEQALTELRELERELAHQATHDSLTGLPNRSMFTEELHLATASAQEHTVLFVDLDGFKDVNDQHGHAAGDAVLVEVAKRLTSLVRPVDTVARFGGDEFAILLLDQPCALAVAQRIVASIAAPIAVPGVQVLIGCSIGLAVSDEGKDPETLLRNADSAMYRAKQGGKGTVVEHDPDAPSTATAAAGLLQTAIELDELELHYQPIVDLTARKIAGVEALVRWRSPERGLLMPGDFLNEAERCGLVGTIDRWVLMRSVEDLTPIWEVDPDLFVSVNLAAQHLLNGSLGKLLEGSDLDPIRGRFVIEWPESVLVAESDRRGEAMGLIKEAGGIVALDRFGDGEASLAYLHRLDIGLLKLDRSMIGHLATPEPKVDLVRGMVQIAHSLGLRVIAEGIEHQPQLDALAQIPCDMAQGYLLARPLRLEELQPYIIGQGLRPPSRHTTTTRLL